MQLGLIRGGNLATGSHPLFLHHNPQSRLVAFKTSCYFKEDPEGVNQVKSVLRKNAEEEAELACAKKVALRMLATGKYTLKEISELTGLSLYMVRKLRTQSQPTT